MTARGYHRLQSGGHEIGLHWDRYEWFERVGIPGFRPLLRGVSLEDQAKKLATISGRRPTLNRNHWLVWEGDFAATFRKLAAAGFTGDSSYGPTGLEIAGYLFGTGLPFHPLDTNGSVFSLLELPFHLQDDEAFSIEAFRALLCGAEGQTVGVVIHPGTMRYRASRDVVRLLRDAATLAREERLEPARVGDFLAFWRARSAATIRSLPETPAFRVECIGFDGAVLDLPQVHRGRALASVTLDGHDPAPDRIVGTGQIRIEPGRHEVVARYASAGSVR
jgi:hypothetical protein